MSTRPSGDLRRDNGSASDEYADKRRRVPGLTRARTSRHRGWLATVQRILHIDSVTSGRAVPKGSLLLFTWAPAATRQRERTNRMTRPETLNLLVEDNFDTSSWRCGPAAREWPTNHRRATAKSLDVISAAARMRADGSLTPPRVVLLYLKHQVPWLEGTKEITSDPAPAIPVVIMPSSREDGTSGQYKLLSTPTSRAGRLRAFRSMVKDLGLSGRHEPAAAAACVRAPNYQPLTCAGVRPSILLAALPHRRRAYSRRARELSLEDSPFSSPRFRARRRSPRTAAIYVITRMTSVDRRGHAARGAPARPEPPCRADRRRPVRDQRAWLQQRDRQQAARPGRRPHDLHAALLRRVLGPAGRAARGRRAH